jgi:hypothetical protein
MMRAFWLKTGRYRFPRLRFNIAQGIIGWLVANALTPEILLLIEPFLLVPTE